MMRRKLRLFLILQLCIFSAGLVGFGCYVYFSSPASYTISIDKDINFGSISISKNQHQKEIQ